MDEKMDEKDFGKLFHTVFSDIENFLSNTIPTKDGRLGTRLKRALCRFTGKGKVWAGNLFVNQELKRWSVSFLHNYVNSRAQLAQLYNNLNDDLSKTTLLWFVKYRLAYAFAGPVADLLYPYSVLQIPNGSDVVWEDENNCTVDNEKYIFYGPLEEIRRHLIYSLGIKQYLLPGIVEVKLGDKVVDAGTCYGDTALWFSRQIGDNGHIYAFEAISHIREILDNNISANKANNVEIFPYALWSNDTKLRYAEGEGGSSRVEESTEGDITACSIDNLFAKGEIQQVDFIKADLEGAERYFLDGAREVIDKFKPRMAISVYHGGEVSDDLYIVPNKIKEYCPDYKLYLRCLTPTSFETVVFATV